MRGNEWSKDYIKDEHIELNRKYIYIQTRVIKKGRDVVL